MSAAIENGVLAIRLDPANPDHHLWNNHGTWWCHFTIYPDALTKQRIRRSLGTRSRAEAHVRRDRLLRRFQTRASPAA